MFINQRLALSDEETVEQFRENVYMQLGLRGLQNAADPSGKLVKRMQRLHSLDAEKLLRQLRQ